MTNKIICTHVTGNKTLLLATMINEIKKSEGYDARIELIENPDMDLEKMNIEKDDSLYIFGFISLETLEYFTKTIGVNPAKIVWFGYDIKSVDLSKHYDLDKSVKGIRTSCNDLYLAVWKYFNPNTPTPIVYEFDGNTNFHYAYATANKAKAFNDGIVDMPYFNDIMAEEWGTLLGYHGYHKMMEAVEEVIRVGSLKSNIDALDPGFRATFDGVDCWAINGRYDSENKTCYADKGLIVAYSFDGRQYHYNLYTSRLMQLPEYMTANPAPYSDGTEYIVNSDKNLIVSTEV